MASIDISLPERGLALADNQRRLQLAFLFLGLFHIVLVGVRLRFGAFPIEFFFVATLVVIGPTLHYIASDRPVDAVILMVAVLIVIRVFATGADLVQHGDHIEERLYFSAHRIAPLFAFAWIYMWRRQLVAGGALETVKKLVIAALVLHGLATIGAAMSEPAMTLVTNVGNLLDATSERSVGVVNNVQTSALTGVGLLRVSGLLKSAPLNAGFIGTLGALAVFLFYRERRHVFLALAIVAFVACVMTFSRGGLATVALAFLVGLAMQLASGRLAQFCVTLMVVAGLVSGGVLVLGLFQGGIFLDIAVDRFSQFLHPERFASAQAKIDATRGFFRLLVDQYLVFFYPGEGLNNMLLRSRGKLTFNPLDTGFVSNSWLLFAYDNGIYYLAVLGALLAKLIADVRRTSPGLFIVLVPLAFAAASDNYYALVVEMHALFWIVLAIVVLFLEGDRRIHDTGQRRDLSRAQPAVRLP